MVSRRGQKIVGLVLSVVLLVILLAVAGCGGDTTGTTSVSSGTNDTGTTVAAGSSKKVAILEATYETSSGKKGGDLLKAALEKLGYQADIIDAGGDYAKLVSLYETAVTQKYDAAINVLGDVTQLKAGYQALSDAKIPILGFDDGPDDRQVINVQSDNTLIGNMMADQLAAAIGGKGNVIEFTLDLVPVTTERMRAVENTLKTKYPDIKIIAVHDIKQPQEAAQDCNDAMANYLTAHPKGEIAGAIFAFDDAANGGVAAINTAGRTEIKVTACDATPQTLTYLLQDATTPWIGTVAQDYAGMAQKLADTCAAIFAGNSPAAGSNVKMTPIWVDKTNASKYLPVE